MMKKPRRVRPEKITMEALKPLLPLIHYVILNHFRWVFPRLKTGLYDIGDLDQQGTLGILRAIELYNPKKFKSDPFSTTVRSRGKAAASHNLRI